MPVGGGVEEEEGKDAGELPGGRGAGSSGLRAFKGGDFRGGPREVAQWNIHQFSRPDLSGSWSPLIGQHQGRGS